MTLPDDYFEKIFGEFEADRKLGIASGNCRGYREQERLKQSRRTIQEEGLKTYRKRVFIRYWRSFRSRWLGRIGQFDSPTKRMEDKEFLRNCCSTQKEKLANMKDYWLVSLMQERNPT